MFRFTLCFVLCATFASAALGQSGVRDWNFKVEDQGTSREKRTAFTPAQPYAEGEPRAVLEVRRLQAKAPMDLVVTVNPGADKAGCKYDNWELAIDSRAIPVKTFSTSPVAAILVPGKGIGEEKFWEPFVKGLELAIRVGRKCEGIFGEQEIEVFIFSLRGSAAAHKFVLNEVDG